MKSIKVTLAGIVFILASLFFMGICIINNGGPEGLALGLFIFGIVVSIIGLFFVKDREDEENESSDEKDYGDDV